METKILVNRKPFDGKRPITLDDKVILELIVKDRNKIIFTVDAKKNIQVLEPITYHPNGSLYQVEVETRLGYDNNKPFIITHYPKNQIRIMKRHMNQLIMEEISIISQYGKLFIVEQETRNEEIARDGMEIVVPELRWSSLDKILTKDTKKEGDHKLRIEPWLLRVTHKVPRKKDLSIPSIPYLGEKQGLVLWYNYGSGAGCIITRFGNAKIRWVNSPIRTSGMQGLTEGEIVEFNKLGNLKKGNTAFKAEILGTVTIVELKEDKKMKPEDFLQTIEKQEGTPATA
ncbi:MAG: hypothetical protein Q7J14_02205 [Candidatus Magasanikbacteria bacterium]|nr:hypothetical protein [Candidatus Magasanikbacteria bacterium]